MNRPNGISAVDPTASQPLPNGTSAVSLRHLSRGTLRHVSRNRTAEMPFKVGLSGWNGAQGRLCRFDHVDRTRRLVRASGAALASGGVALADQKLKISKAKGLMV